MPSTFYTQLLLLPTREPRLRARRLQVGSYLHVDVSQLSYDGRGSSSHIVDSHYHLIDRDSDHRAIDAIVIFSFPSKACMYLVPLDL